MTGVQTCALPIYLKMLQFSPLRTAIIAIVAVLGILFTIPNFVPRDFVNAMPDWLPKQRMVLGLDLQGGSYLLLQVNRQNIIDERMRDLRREVRTILANDNGIGHLLTTDGLKLTISWTDPSQLDKAREALKAVETVVGNSVFSVGGVKETEISTSPDGKIIITLTEKGIDQRMSTLVTQSIEVIRRRIDELGTTEPTIQRQGTDRILVQVPGFDDSQRLKDLISQTARLTFHMVHPSITAGQALAQDVRVTEDALIVDLADGRTVSVPLAWYPRLAHGTSDERTQWRLIGRGEGIHWPALDEDISVQSLLAGRGSGETDASLQRWLQARRAAG